MNKEFKMNQEFIGMTAIAFISIIIMAISINYNLSLSAKNRVNILVIESLKYQNSELIKVMSRKNQFFLTLSAYSLSIDQCNDDLENTALMQKPVPGYTCAVSQDLCQLLGKKVFIKGYGVFYVNDLMNKRFTNSIDILLGSKKSAMKIGKQIDIEVILIESFNIEEM